MAVCGIEIRGRDAVLVIGNLQADQFRLVDIAMPKLSITDENDPTQLHSLKATFEGIVKEHQVNLAAIKARPSAGRYAGGPASFKIEVVLQLAVGCHVHLLHPRTIAAAVKDSDRTAPEGLQKYRSEAYKVALALALGGQQ